MTQTKTILLTGGLGYIGSIAAVELLNRGYQVVIVDNLINSKPEVEQRIRHIVGEAAAQRLTVHIVDLLDEEALEQVFCQHLIDGVIHFAGLKAVGESVKEPYLYYKNNIIGSLNLFKVMKEFKVKDIIFSSSATVYPVDTPLPFTESTAVPARAFSPYGQTKINLEYILSDLAQVGDLRAISLRYFNPIGAHPSGLLGEELIAMNNVVPFISGVYLGRSPLLKIFGNDYPTPDGTCQRDYIHIMDLVEGHILALEYLFAHPELSYDTFNLGSGVPYSVKEILDAFNRNSDRQVPFAYAPKRVGDIPTMIACPQKAEQYLGFKVKRDLDQAMQDQLIFLNTFYKEEKEKSQSLFSEK